MPDSEHLIELDLSNKTQKDLFFFMEPEATRYCIPPEATFRIVFRSSSPGVPQIDVLKEDFVSVWAFSGSRYQIFHDGKEVKPPRG